MYKRNGLFASFPVSSLSKKVHLPLIELHTKPGSVYSSDDWHAYGSLSITGDHVVVKRRKENQKDDLISTV